MTPLEYVKALPALPLKKFTLGADHRIYFVRAENGLIKVGFSTDIKTRVKGLCVGSPIPLDLIGVAIGSKSVEAIMHMALEKSYARGEWFYPSERILQLIAYAQTKAWLRFAKSVEWKSRWDLPPHARRLSAILDRRSKAPLTQSIPLPSIADDSDAGLVTVARAIVEAEVAR